jgi:Family of unknown function (DUF6492)
MTKFEIFSAARLRDFPILLAAARQCQKLWKPAKLVVAVPGKDVAAVRTGLGGQADVVDENTLLTGFNRHVFQARPIAYFPRSFGWYLQQFLKIQYCLQSSAEYCLVWDADTVPLKPLEYTDEQGRIYLTRADELHDSYFYTIDQLFGVRCRTRTSFVSQHMFVKTSAMRSMCGMIEDHHHVKHWTDALGNILEKHPQKANLFSEYETYANYMLTFEPEAVTVRELAWRRDTNPHAWGIPCKQLNEARRQGLNFVAYESNDVLWSRIFLKSLENAPALIKRFAVLFVLRQSGGAI